MKPKVKLIEGHGAYAFSAQAALTKVTWAIYDAAKGNYDMALQNIAQAKQSLAEMEAHIGELDTCVKQQLPAKVA